MEVSIDEMTSADWPQVREIYLEGIASGEATFAVAAPEWEVWDAGHLKRPRFVARQGKDVLGWVAVSPVSDRCVYRGVAEVSVYVAEAGRGRGVGNALLEALVLGSEEEGIWTLQARIFPENVASVKLHLRNGFREVGRRERIGKMKDVWRDTVLLERRSKIVGSD
jgi:phosphinothricin acetyltransferase